jgi:alpha-tubulin suppressor-like RCC1 family protein
MKRILTATLATALSLGTLAAIAPRADAVTPPPAIKISTSGFSAVVIAADGVPYGSGPITGSDSLHTLTRLDGLPAGVRATAAASGDRHAVVLGSNGVAYGIGDDDHGQLSVVGESSRSKFVAMQGLPAGVKATAVAAKGDHTLVLGSNGIAYGVGDNTERELTGLSTLDKPVLSSLTGLPSGVKAVGIDAGSNHSLVLGSNGVAYGAGRNSSYQLTGADAATKTSLMPLLGMPGGITGVAVAAGFDSSLLLGSNGVVYGAGSNTLNQLTGSNTAAKTVLTPLAGLPGGVKVTSIDAGDYHSLVLGDDGTAYGSGYNEYGQLTGLNFGAKDTLTPLLGLPAGVKATGVAAGGFDSLLLGSDSLVYGMGYNGGGQLTGPSVMVVAAPTVMTGQLPTAATAPTFGAVRVGHPVSVSKGSWLPAPTAYGYRWRRNGVAIAGATKSTYTPTAADFGRLLSVTVTASRSGLVTGSSTSVARKVGPIATLRWTAKKKPAVSGAAKVGKTLKVRNVTRAGWSPAASKISYHWYRGAKPIAGATRSTYKLKKADKGQRISVRVYGHRAVYGTGTFISRTTPTVKG